MRSKLCFLMALLATSIWGFCEDKSGTQAFTLYVGNSRGNNVSMIDVESLKVTGALSAGEHVHGVCLRGDGKILFATVETDQTLRVIDTATQQTLATIKVSGRPNQCAATPDGKYVVVPIRDKDVVDIVDVKQQTVAKSLPIKEPHNALNAGSNRYIYVSAMTGNEIDLIDLEKMEFSARIPVGGRPRPYVVSADGKTMYVAIADLHGFAIVDIPAKKVIERVEIPSENKTLRKLLYETQDTLTHGLAITPDGSELWVSSLLDDAMYIYNLKEKKVTGRVNTGLGPNWIVFNPDGRYAYVSNAESDDVSVIDAKSKREVTRVKVGKAPKRLAIAIAAARSNATRGETP